MYFSLRQLIKSPGFTAVALLTLALGIAANTVVFSVAKVVLFRPLGFEGEDRLMWIRIVNTQSGLIENSVSWQEMEDIRESTRSFASIATYGSFGAMWQQGDRVTQVPALQVTPNLAEVLDIRPVLGRMVSPADSAPGAERVLLLSWELWQSQYGGTPEVLGQTVRIDKKAYTIVGVLPPRLHFPTSRAPLVGTGNLPNAGLQSFWLPMDEVRGEDRVSRRNRMFLPIARLKADVTPLEARAELSALGQRLADDFPVSNRYWNFDLISLRDQVMGPTRHAIPVLTGAVLAVLLICCVNLANLLLARGVVRQRELAVRLALGAGRRRLVQMLMKESAALAIIGGLLGIGLAHVALSGIRIVAGPHIPFIDEAKVDGIAVAFTAGLSLLTALVFGLLPALQPASVEAAETLRTGTRTTGGRQIRAWQRNLLAGQIAAVLVLLVSAGLLLESFRRLVSQDLGYRPRAVVTVDVSAWDFATNEEMCRLYRTLFARLSTLPGVQAVGTVSSIPLTGKWTFDEPVQVVGQPRLEAERPSVAGTFVAFDYFQALDIPLLEGRFFRHSELKDNGYGQVILLNQAAAKVLFPDRSAIGGHLTVGSNKDRVLEVVGVVKDTRDVRLEEKPKPRLYWHYASGGAQLVIRSTIPSQALIPLLRDTIQQTDSRIVRQTVMPMTEVVSATIGERRFLMTMLTAYAALALAIAIIGIFGVVAYQVAQRTNEFGVRLALGATPAALIRLVLMQAIRIVLAGLMIGLPLAIGLTHLLRNQLFQVSPHDPLLFVMASVVLVVMALLASYWPARRAARVDPMTALRYE